MSAQRNRGSEMARGQAGRRPAGAGRQQDRKIDPAPGRCRHCALAKHRQAGWHGFRLSSREGERALPGNEGRLEEGHRGGQARRRHPAYLAAHDGLHIHVGRRGARVDRRDPRTLESSVHCYLRPRPNGPVAPSGQSGDQENRGRSCREAWQRSAAERRHASTRSRRRRRPAALACPASCRERAGGRPPPGGDQPDGRPGNTT